MSTHPSCSTTPNSAFLLTKAAVAHVARERTCAAVKNHQNQCPKTAARHNTYLSVMPSRKKKVEKQKSTRRKQKKRYVLSRAIFYYPALSQQSVLALKHGLNQIAISFFFQILKRNKLQGSGVHAVTQPSHILRNRQ